MTTESLQRKIELQSPEDLSYLIRNVRSAAATRLNEAFPPVAAGGDDALRTEIEALVNEYIDKTFALAAPNLTINGLPVQPEAFVETKKSRKAGGGKSAKIKEPPPAHEPFDARKRQRVADLTTQEERLLEEVASLKRSVPARAAADQADALKAGLTRDDEALRDAAVSVRKRVREQLADEGGDSLDLGVEPLDRQDVIEEEYTTAIEVLARLKTDMSAIVARMERARVAGEYVLDQS